MSSAATAPTSTPLQDFEQKAIAFFETEKAKLLTFVDDFLPIAENAVEVALTDLAEIAGQSILDQAGAVISGNEKFGAAVANVVQTVEASGKTVAMQTAQTAVQGAYLAAQQVAKANAPAAS